MGAMLLGYLVKFVLSVLGLVGTFVLGKLSLYLDEKKKATVVAKGATAYNHALSVAQGLYLVLDKEFAGIEKAGLDKKVEMEKRLLEIFPSISATELESINQAVHQELKDKILTPLLTPAVDDVIITPVVDVVPVKLPIETKEEVEDPTPVIEVTSAVEVVSTEAVNPEVGTELAPIVEEVVPEVIVPVVEPIAEAPITPVVVEPIVVPEAIITTPVVIPVVDVSSVLSQVHELLNSLEVPTTPTV